MSGISWTLEALMYYIVARAFGIHEGFHIFLLLTAAANLAIAIVASQGGIGPFELVVSKTVVAFGAASELGSAYAIGLHALLIFPVVMIGLYLMWSMQFNFGDMIKGNKDGDVTGANEGDDPPLSRVSSAAAKPERA